MHGQGAQDPPIQNSTFCSMTISPTYFFAKNFLRKNWRGGNELLLKDGTLDGYAF